MTNKESFNPEEWTKLLESTMLAGMAVSAADPTGVGDDQGGSGEPRGSAHSIICRSGLNMYRSISSPWAAS